MAKILFASPEAEIAKRPLVLEASEQLERLAASTLTPQRAAEGFELLDRAQRSFRRHDLYLFLRYALDTRREEALAESANLGARVRSAKAAFSKAMAEMSSEDFEAAVRVEPKLAAHRFAYSEMKRQASHALDPGSVKTADFFGSIVTAADYGRIISTIEFESVDDGQGNSLDPLRDGNAIYSNPNPEVAREGSRKLYRGLASQRDALALLMTATVRRENAAARSRGFEDAREQAAWERTLPKGAVERMLQDIGAQADFYKQWQVLNPRALTTKRSWTTEELRRDVVAAAAALGPAYKKETDALLDPASGRVDLAGGPHRLPITGAASVYPIGTSIIYGGEFFGSLYDLIVIAHEAGHAVQAQLMFEAEVAMPYATGPGFFTESFGRFQELLLLRYLVNEERDNQVKEELSNSLEARLLAVFPSSEEAGIELRLHADISTGEALTADAFDLLTAEEGGKYSNEYVDEPERKGLWQLSESYFQAPLHKIDNLYSALLAVRYFADYESDPAAFTERYLSLLEGGYDATPAELLRSRLGIDLEDPNFTGDVLRWLETRVGTSQ